MKLLIGLLLIVPIVIVVCCDEAKEKPDWAKKDIRDYNDADMERLFDQWEEDDEPLPDDELPLHKRKSSGIDLSQINLSDPELMMKLSKKGKPVMIFVSLFGLANKHELERVSALYQSSLMNNHLIAERYVIGEDRILLMFQNGYQAWDAKDYLIEQEHVREVIIESKTYPGKYAPPGESKHFEL